MARKRQVSILYVIGLTRLGFEPTISCMRDQSSTDSATAPGGFMGESVQRIYMLTLKFTHNSQMVKFESNYYLQHHFFKVVKYVSIDNKFSQFWIKAIPDSIWKWLNLNPIKPL